jgi:hypothetical protein
MAQSYPAQLPEFFDALQVTTATFELPVTQQVSRTAGGEVITAELGASLWRGSVTLANRPFTEANAVLARLRLMARPGASFLMRPVGLAVPVSDPAGSVSGSSVTIDNLPAGGREMSLSGLPSGFVLTAGDCLSFPYGSSPVRYGFHQIVAGAIADRTGTTPAFEVVPPLRPGAAVGAQVALIDPMLKAVVDPGSVREGREIRNKREGISFGWIQTLR